VGFKSNHCVVCAKFLMTGPRYYCAGLQGYLLGLLSL